MKKLTKEKKYFKYIDKNIKNLNEKDTVLILGATGSMASYLALYLSYLHCNLVLAARNLKEVEELKNQLKEYNVKIETVYVDYSNIKSIDDIVTFVKKHKITKIINNIGIYHQPTKFINNIEWTFYINYLAPFYLFESLKEVIKTSNISIINVGSISYLFKKINFDDVESLRVKNKTLRYSQSKSFLMSYSEYLKTLGINSIIVHPGITTTNLFAKKNNAYPKIFYLLIVPIMKVLFMSYKKAALSLLLGCDKEEVPELKWIGPRGLFHSWGYPNVQKLRKSRFSKKDIELRYSKSLEYIKKMN